MKEHRKDTETTFFNKRVRNRFMGQDDFKQLYGIYNDRQKDSNHLAKNRMLVSP